MALPVLGIIMLGLLEFGMAWHESIVLDRALSVATRTGSNLADNELADFETLRALDAGLSGLNNSTVTRVIIWEVDDADGEMPAGCKALTPAASSTSPLGNNGLNCNVYSPTQLAAGLPENFGTDAACFSSDWDRFWCPKSRSNGTNPDHLGLYVEIEYDTFTGLMGDSMTIERQAVYALEQDSAFEG